jgi:two-component system, NarL family, nitrate/nitrite response regulator NarL
MGRGTASLELNPGEEVPPDASKNVLLGDRGKNAKARKTEDQKSAARRTQTNCDVGDSQGAAPPIGIVLVAPRLLFREALARILIPENFCIAASASNISEVMPSSRHHQSLLLIIDATDDMGAAIGQITEFKARYPAGRVAVINDRSQPKDMVLALRAGVNAYVSKVESLEAFIKSIQVLMLGQTLLWPGNLSHILEHSARPSFAAELGKVVAGAAPSDGRIPRLSRRQRSVLRCLVEGATNKVIASTIDVDENTVKGHVRAVLHKINARNRTQAAVWALKQGNDF